MTWTQVDALYKLPSTLMNDAPVFGTSTRSDWENTVKNKRDSINPYAGPCNYNTSNIQVLSTCNASPTPVFLSSNRAPSDETYSPGPAYHVDGIYKNGRDKQLGIGFNKDQRKPDRLDATDAVYYPQLPKGNAPKIGVRLKGTLDVAGKCSPGPVRVLSTPTNALAQIYETQKYDFRTGPAFSFGSSKASRFQGSLLGS